MDIPGKITIITGASAGIGLVTARRFAAAGAKLVLVARSADKLAALAEELAGQGHDALPLPADMRDPAAVGRMIEQAFEHYGRIDILINNAGQAAAGTVAQVSPDDYREIIELNLFGPLYAIQAAVPLMRQGGGLIINISSMVTKMHIPGLAAYASTKSALNMLSDTARVELAPDNIRVITVYPRLTATDFGRNSLGNQTMRQGQRGHGGPSGAPAGMPTADTAEFVADRILDAAQREPAEQFMDA
jgi:NAD(P)-dependent dehydrogenase (short-subunit alcohol dehydrogenase family)